jgi:DNA-binding Lrp family transcriptional regulator
MRTISEDASDFLTRLVPFVESDGARNLNQISRDLPIPYQTLRKRMMNLKERGIVVASVPDVEKIGLERIRASFYLTSPEKEVKALFGGLHQSAGLRSYARAMISQKFDCEFAIPRRTLDQLSTLLGSLEEMKLIRGVKLQRLVWKEILMLKTQFFDYAKGEWDVDFTRLSGDPSVEIPAMSEPVRFDYPDLLMIRDLEVDSWIKTVEMARKAGLSFGDAVYHLNNHVLARKLIKSFRLRWNGRKEAWLKHSIMGTLFEFKEMTDEKARHAMSIMTSNPFTWSHMRTENGNYLVEALFPVSVFQDAIQYVSSQLRSVGLRPRLYIKDWSCVSTFTIPYTLYNKERAAWDFNSEHALEYTLQMIKTYSS